MTDGPTNLKGRKFTEPKFPILFIFMHLFSSSARISSDSGVTTSSRHTYTNTWTRFFMLWNLFPVWVIGGNMTCASKTGFIWSQINNLSIFDIIKNLFPLRASLCLFWLKHLGCNILQGRLLKSQPKFQPDRHKQALSESPGCDLCQGSVCQCQS